MAGVDSVYAAAFQRAGIERIFQVEDMFDCAGLLARHQNAEGGPRGDRHQRGRTGRDDHRPPPQLRWNPREAFPGDDRQAEQVPAGLLVARQPRGHFGDAPPERYAGAVEIVLQDPGVDAVLVILTPQSMTDPTARPGPSFKASARARSRCWRRGWGRRRWRRERGFLDEAGIPTYDTPEKAVRAFMHLVSYAKNLEILYETPREIPMSFSFDRQRVREQFAAVLGEENEVLSEEVSKTLLDAYGIPVTKPVAAGSAEDAAALAKQMGYPVVMKIDSPQITHKTEVGGVVLNLASDRSVAAAFKEMTERAQASPRPRSSASPCKKWWRSPTPSR